RDHEHPHADRVPGRGGQETADRGQGQAPAPAGARRIPVDVLRTGGQGEAVRDLQARLAAAGHDCTPDEPGVFGSATEEAVRAFQGKRGLRVDGLCGAQTWAALVEAGWRLGDRLLYQASPFLRGDDVAELQRRL